MNNAIAALQAILTDFRNDVVKSDAPKELFAIIVKNQEKKYNSKKGDMKQADKRVSEKLVEMLRSELPLIGQSDSPAVAFAAVKKNFAAQVNSLKTAVAAVAEKLSNMYSFAEDVWHDGQELLIVTTELTADSNTASFINKFGCKQYFQHNKDLLLYDRQDEITKALEELKL